MTFCIFTTESNGIFKTQPMSEEDYERAKANRLIPSERFSEVPDQVPYFMALVRVEDNFDFVLDASRTRYQDYEAPVQHQLSF